MNIRVLAKIKGHEILALKTVIKMWNQGLGEEMVVIPGTKTIKLCPQK